MRTIYRFNNKKLFQLRMKKFFIQTQLAEKLGVSHDAISRWEIGLRSPSFENLKKLCEYFDIPAEDWYELSIKIKNKTKCQ